MPQSSESEKAKTNCGRIYSDPSTVRSKVGEEAITRNIWHIMVEKKEWLQGLKCSLQKECMI